MPESGSQQEQLERAGRLKEVGNGHFKKKEYKKAAKCYSQALELSPKGHPDSAVFFKNRCACWLKLESYDKALSDSVAALEISPSDVKALYRGAQALEAIGQLADAFRNIKKLLSIEPRNKDGLEMARRLATTIKKQSDAMQSTDTIVDEMLSALSAESELSVERKTQAAKNCAILSRDNAGAERIFQAGGVAKLIPLLDSDVPEIVHHVLQTFVGLCTEHRSRAFAVIQNLSLEKISSLISSPHSNICTSAVAILKQAALATTGEDKRTPKGAESAVVTSETALIVPVIQMLFISLMSHDVSAEARDNIIEMLIVTATQGGLGELYMREGLVGRLLLLATMANQSEASPVEVRLPVSDDCLMNIAVVLSKLYESFGKNKDLKETFTKESGSFVIGHLSKGDQESKTKGLTALITLLQGVVEVGNIVLGEESTLKIMVETAESEDFNSQIIAAEALALSASDKDRCHGIMAKGLPVLKQLYAAKDDRVRVRALVGLCKIGSVGGSNVNARTFAEGSTLKLEKSCRKFIVSAKKGDSLRKWAAEGLAFLSLDAEVKEALIQDIPALKVLFTMHTSADLTLVYGIATIFVNLTNSYDKPERNPELEALGKYAGENVPKEHELDGPEYVKKRVTALLDAGVVPALVGISSCESVRIHEQVSRVLLALAEETSHRGAIVQQGGMCLIALSRDNTDAGKLVAAQALAKIAITSDPKLAFPGQRALELVRPLVQLLKSEKGLQNFEGLMALTNLAGMNDDLRRRIFREGGVQYMESLMFEEHELIRRAATEALCNMISLEEVHKRFYSNDVERVKLWVLFSGEEDEKLVKAASGGLAQLSHDPKICEKIVQVKSAMDIFKELVGSKDSDLQYRGVYILANLIDASKEIAQKIIEEEFLEIFMAFVQAEGIDDKVKEVSTRALARAMEYGLIKPNPELTAGAQQVANN